MYQWNGSFNVLLPLYLGHLTHLQGLHCCRNRSCSQYLPSLHALTDWWDNKAMSFDFCRGELKRDKICLLFKKPWLKCWVLWRGGGLWCGLDSVIKLLHFFGFNIGCVFTRTILTTIGDKNKRIHTTSLSPPFNVGVFFSPYGVSKM